MNFSTLFHRNKMKADLTPGERAFLKLLQGFGYVVLINVFFAVFQYLNTHGTINWSDLLAFAGAQAALALALAIGKYFSAQGDITLGDLIDGVTDEVLHRVPSAIRPIDIPVSAPMPAPEPVTFPAMNTPVVVPASSIAVEPPTPAPPPAQQQTASSVESDPDITVKLKV